LVALGSHARPPGLGSIQPVVEYRLPARVAGRGRLDAPSGTRAPAGALGLSLPGRGRRRGRMGPGPGRDGRVRGDAVRGTPPSVGAPVARPGGRGPPPAPAAPLRTPRTPA